MKGLFVNQTLRGIVLINQRRFFAVLVLTLSAQFALVVNSTSSSAAHAASVLANGAVAMSASTYSVARTAGSITLTVRRSGGTQGALSVSYKTVDGTALSGKQFTAKAGTLTWASGDGGNKTLNIPISNATPFIGTKWFAVRLTAGTGTIVGTPSNATVNIVGTASDTAGSVTAGSVAVNGAVTMSTSLYSVARSASAITLTVVRNGGSQGALSVSYKTVDGTAVAGKQYTGGTGTLTWASGDAGNKTFNIPISNATSFTGTKWFAVRLTAGTGTIVGSPSNAIVNIVGGTPTVTKSIRDWVTCNETIDESFQLEQALLSAANNAFTLIVDCPVRFHTGTASLRSIAVPDGVTISFQGAGEFLTVSNGPPALTIAHPSEVTFLDWNLTFL